MKKWVLSGVVLSFCFMAVPCHAVDYFTEYFGEPEAFDLDGFSLTFTPDASASGYSARLHPITALPTDQGDLYTLTGLADDKFVNQQLADGASVVFYGNTYSNFYIGSNGYITFDEGDITYSVSSYTHFNQPRISALYTDLYPDPEDRGNVRWGQFADRVVVAFIDVREYSTSNSNTFQIELFYDGVIRLSWLGIEASNLIVGLSRGGGEPLGFVETNFSDFMWDTDEDGLPNFWESLYFGGITAGNPFIDSDGDGHNNLDEYIAGTHPLEKASVFHARQSIQQEGGETRCVIEWDALEGREYSIRGEANLIIGDFSNVLQSGINYPVNAYTTTVEQAHGTRFYKVGVELAE